MTEQQVKNKMNIKGNKLIVEYLNRDIKELKGTLDYIDLNSGEYILRDFSRNFWLKTIQYHTSWDWLMPVVAHIIENTKNNTYSMSLRMCIPDIDMTYSHVIEFIEWYNANEK